MHSMLLRGSIIAIVVATSAGSSIEPYPYCAKVNEAYFPMEVIAGITNTTLCSSTLDRARVSVVKSVAECAERCSKQTTCSYWTVGVVAGDFRCWLISDETITPSKSKGFASGTSECYPLSFPDCISNDIIYNGPNATVWLDAVAYGSDEKRGCYEEDCSWTDTFRAKSVDGCAAVCAGVATCAFWSYDGDSCALKSIRAASGVKSGMVSGTRLCGEAALLIRKKKSEQVHFRHMNSLWLSTVSLHSVIHTDTSAELILPRC